MGNKKEKKQKKEKKPKVEEVDAVAAEAASKGRRQHGEEADGHGSAGGQADEQPGAKQGKQSRSTISLVPEEVTKYLTEIVEHFKTLVDDEERQLLVGNVLEEIAGKEQLVAGDPTCSRHMEVLLGAAPIEQLLHFVMALMDTGGLGPVACSPFGSHVAEKLLIRLSDAHDVMNETEYELMSKLMKRVSDELCESLWQFMTDRFATHVARRVLCVLCGSNVLSAGSRGPDKAKPAAGGKEAESASSGAQLTSWFSKTKQSGAAAAALVAKFGGDTAGKGAASQWLQQVPCRFPDHIQAIISVLCRDDFSGPNMTELVTGRYASPFLQAALRAAASMPNHRDVLSALIPALMGATFFVEGSKRQGKVLEGVSADNVAAMSQDANGSHVLEVVLSVAGLVPGLLAELTTRFFTGKVADAAFHGTANFVVQSLLSACTNQAQLAPIYEELSGRLSDLLRRRRAGVVAALAAACARCSCLQKELGAALSAALTSYHPWEGQPATKVLAAALLSLDVPVPVIGTGAGMPDVAALCGGTAPPLPRMSALGGTILINVLKFQQGACRDFTDSLIGLPPADLARVGRDPVGARALESLIDGTAPVKVKQKLLDAMKGSWAVVASSGSGSFLVEKCYATSDASVKEAIVSELAAAERHLLNLHWGAKLLTRVGAETYKRDPAQWRRASQSSTKALAEFAELFGSDAAPKASADAGEGKPSKKHKHSDGQGGPLAGGEQSAGGDGDGQETGEHQAAGKPKKNKRRKGEEEAGQAGEAGAQGDAALQGEGEAGEADDSKRHKKSKKRSKQQAAEAEVGHVNAAAGEQAEDEAGNLKKKKKKTGKDKGH